VLNSAARSQLHSHHEYETTTETNKEIMKKLNHLRLFQIKLKVLKTSGDLQTALVAEAHPAGQ
jgi:hypothetical protein